MGLSTNRLRGDVLDRPDVCSSDRASAPVTLEQPVTLLAAMHCGDHILMGADRLVTEGGGSRWRNPKLWTRQDVPLAVGFTGGEDVGRPFKDWLLAHRPDSWTWPALVAAAFERLAQLNRDRRQRAAQAGATANTSDLASVLVAASLGGVLDLWDLSHDGAMLSVKHHALAVLGSGSSHARLAYETLVAQGAPRTAETMGAVLEQTCLNAPGCDGPWDLLRITHEGVTEIRHEGGGWTGQPVKLLDA